MSKLVPSVFFVIGAALPVASITDGVASVLVTFFGLMATAILAALSLLVGNVLSSAWTVSKLIALKAELDLLISKMTRTLGVLIAGSICVIVHRIGVPPINFSHLPDWIYAEWISGWATDIPTRLIQGLIVLSLGVCADQITLVSKAFSKVLTARYELALADSRRRTEQAAPTNASLELGFRTPKDFGARIPRAD
ncbi:hypothetical protein BYZ73_20400 [Rhodovulum viride]|uniref:Uncharacterized protein n=1 Tax=Rhodovulum viride TaxID=1231134 RepID=A0ABX9DCY5_9RHOB|nr:hypothetical protein [Rhodovulum viride]RAP39461.1 hypothetical protein BYZ73_20400 [Rhodovulum viride]